MNNYKKLAFIFLMSSVTAFAQGDKPLKGLNIMLDPGHGGADSGAVGKLGLKESDTNLRVARYLKMLLEHDGANVKLTREKPETTLSLSNRVAMSNKEKPDLFISIHHNASLHPRSTNQSEIYFNAKDRGVSYMVGSSMNTSLAEAKFAGDSKIIPAGFYVLRNNDAPSILTEGSYISLPESEKNLRSGKGLTTEAAIIWKSIRKAYSNGPLKLNLLTNEEAPLIVDSPYFNILFTANKPVNVINARLNSTELDDIGLKNIMAYPMTYSIYNNKPLSSGIYDLTMAAIASDGTPSAQKKLCLNIVLPIEKAELKPVAPYIPLGFKGRFPINIKLYDSQNRINTRSALVKVTCEDNTTKLISDPSGISTVFIELDGNESKEVLVKAEIENSEPISIKIPVAMPIERFVMGKITGHDGKDLANASISHKGKIITTTNSSGLFYFSYPLNENKFEIDVAPVNGHFGFSETIITNGEPVVLPKFEAKAVSPALYGKRIAIMAQPQLEEMARNLITPMKYAGVSIKRLNLPEGMDHPEYQAVLEANLAGKLDIILSLKSENSKGIEIRHYHSSSKGKKIADAIKNNFIANYPTASIKSCAGSDYELGHTGATSVVIAIPNKPDDKTRAALLNQISATLSNGQQ